MRPMKRENNYPVETVFLNGVLYRCEIRPRNEPGTAVYDSQSMSRLYHGIAVINTGADCSSYDIDREHTGDVWKADPSTKRGSVNGSYPLDAPISEYNLKIHNRFDNPVASWIDFE